MRRSGFRFNRGRVATRSFSGGAPVVPNLAAIFGADLKVWIDPDDTGNSTVSGQGFSQLVNKGDASLFTSIDQATDANRMRAYALRGSRAMVPCASSRRALVATFLNTPTGIPQPYTVIWLKGQIGTGTQVMSARAGNTATVQTIGATWPKTIRGAAPTNLTSTDTVAEDEVWWGEFLANGASSAIRKNGGTPLTGNAGTNAWDGLVIGANMTPSSPDTAAVGDYAIVGRAITAPERLAVDAYFADKYQHGGTLSHFSCLGDSLTAALLNSTTGTGWRGMVAAVTNNQQVSGRWLVANGDQRGFVNFHDDRHGGISGDDIAQATTHATNMYGASGLYASPIIHVMIGVNNCKGLGAGYTAGVTILAYNALINQIDTDVTAKLGTRPRIMVTTVVAVAPALVGSNANILSFNAELQASWVTMQGAGLLIDPWDAYTALPYSVGDFGADDTHWNDTGALKYAGDVSTPNSFLGRLAATAALL